jgi:hypothetical protein
MEDNTDKDKTMRIYKTDAESGSITTVDVFHFIELQVKTINSQNRVIQLLDEKAKLTQEVDKLWDELNHYRNG